MSALTLFKGDPPWLYSILNQGVTQNPSVGTAGTMDASTEKIAFVGCVWHPTVKTGTINIRKIRFQTGAVTFDAASTVRMSLQTVSATAGPPYQPDGSQDQTYDFASGAGLTANSWITSGNLSADRAVDLSAVSLTDANSRWLAVVWEYTTFTAADSIIIQGVVMNAAPLNSMIGGQTLLNTGAWAVTNVVPSVALECDDGTFAYLEGCMPYNTFSSAAVSSSAAIRAAGLKFKFPMEVTAEGFGLLLQVPNGADTTITIYDSDGTTALVSAVVDNDAVASATNRLYAMIRCQPITFAANTYYRCVIVGTSATSTNILYGTVDAAALMDGMIGGQDMHWTERDSGGTWTDTTTRRPCFAIKLSSVHDGAGGGGGLIRHPGMNGGLI